MALPRPVLSFISSNSVNDNGWIFCAGAKAAALFWTSPVAEPVAAPVAALVAAPVVGVTPTPLPKLDVMPLLSDGASFGFLAPFSAFSAAPGGRCLGPETMAAYAGRPC